MRANHPALDAADHYDALYAWRDAMAKQEEWLARQFLLAMEQPANAPVRLGLMQRTASVADVLIDDALIYDNFRERAVAILQEEARTGNPDAKQLFKDVAEKWASMNTEAE